MTPATGADRPAVEAALRRDIDRAMFPLSNLARHGMAGGHDRAMSFWAEGDAVLGITGNGVVMPLLPGGYDVARAAAALRGRRIAGFLGETRAVRALVAATGLAGAPAKLDEDEPHFALALRDLTVPDGPGVLAPLRAHHRAALRFRAAYAVEMLGEAPEDAALGAVAEIADAIESGSHVLLADETGPLAMTGFNAALPEAVQVGGVYVPPRLRGRGLARRAVALHLAGARARGATRAILFAGSDQAARAYRAIGFRQIGSFTLIFLREPAHA